MFLCLGGFGCTLADTAVHNTFLGPCDFWNDHYEDGRNLTLARLAWQRVCCELPDAAPDYRDGFLEGYADYLKYGGNGEPPAVVPARYRREQLRTGTGWCAASSWIAGFRHGAKAACESGQRLRPPTALACDRMPLNPYGPVPIAPTAGAVPTPTPTVASPAIPSPSPLPPVPAPIPAPDSLPLPTLPMLMPTSMTAEPRLATSIERLEPISREVNDPRMGGTP
jgi:hypothetical protein